MAARAKEALGASLAAASPRRAPSSWRADAVIRDIAGRQNHSVKLARKLQKKKHRRERGLLVGEGMDLLLAAVAGGADVREILVRRELLSRAAGRPARAGGRVRPAGQRAAGRPARGLDIGVCDQETLDYASSLGGSADVIFIVRAARVAAWPISTWAADSSSSSTAWAIRATWAPSCAARVAFGAGRGHLLAGHRRSVRPQGAAGRHGSPVLAAGGDRGGRRPTCRRRLAALAERGRAGRRGCWWPIRTDGVRRARGLGATGGRRAGPGQRAERARARVGAGASGSPSRSAASIR